MISQPFKMSGGGGGGAGLQYTKIRSESLGDNNSWAYPWFNYCGVTMGIKGKEVEVRKKSLDTTPCWPGTLKIRGIDVGSSYGPVNGYITIDLEDDTLVLKGNWEPSGPA